MSVGKCECFVPDMAVVNSDYAVYCHRCNNLQGVAAQWTPGCPNNVVWLPLLHEVARFFLMDLSGFTEVTPDE